jgi:glycerol-3-phosphate dehydrogenase
MNPRRRSRRTFDGQVFDVLVIGGGITGVAIARECAQRGMRTLIAEQHDFASGATSRSTRIIHGGLRGLKRGDIVQARECLRERDQLMERLPHLVKPMQFLLALPRNPLNVLRSSLTVRTGLWLYQLMNGSKQARPDAARAFETQLDSGQSWSVFPYEDAQCEFPERVVAEWLGEALAAGAVACNYTQALKVARTSGRASGAYLRDALTGDEFTVGATWVINAAGAWAERIIKDSNLFVEPILEGIRGSHLLLPLFPGAPKQAVRAEASNGSATVVIPWNGQILVGTSNVSDSRDPAQAAPDALEIDHLMNSFLRLFPGAGLTRSDIRGSYSGIWAGPSGSAEKTQPFSGRHILHEHGEQGAIGLISVTGGDLSSAVTVARDVARTMGLAMAKPAGNFGLGPSEDSMESALKHWVRLVAFKARITNESAHALAEWYGRNALAVAQIASLDERLREPICSHSTHLLAEAVYAVQQEHAVTLADIVLRRVPVALGPCWSERCSREAALRIGTALDWDHERIAMELDELEEERERFLHPGQGFVPALASLGRMKVAEVA